MDRPPDDARDDPGEAEEPEPGRADLLAIALLVFFVSLMGVVGALLLLPVLL